MAKAVVSIAYRMEILQRWAQDRPKAGNEEQAWCEQLAEDLNLTPQRVRGVVAEEKERSFAEYKGGLQTSAQEIAQTLGATASAAIAVLKAALGAESVRVMRDGNGNPLRDEEGNLVEQRTPDWAVQIKAAGMLLDVHDSYSPRRVEVKVDETINQNISVDVEMNLIDLPLEELHERAASAQRAIADAIATKLLAAPPAGAGSDRGGAEAAPRPARPVVLGHGNDRDHR